MTTMTSRQFNQELGRAKKAAKDGPVFVTDRGRQTHVLLSIEEYCKRRRKGGLTFAEQLGDEAAAAVDFEIPSWSDEMVRPAEFE